MKKPFIVTLFLTLLCLNTSVLQAQILYVSPGGKDENPGTKEKPVASFAKAQMLARKTAKTKSVEVIFAKGVYYLPQTIQFTAEDSKTEKASVTYKAETEGDVVISGGSLLALQWKALPNGIFVAKIKDKTSIDQLYINGERQRMARFPNALENKNVFDTWDLNHNAPKDPSKNPISTSRISGWKNPEGGFIHAMHSSLWGDMHWIIQEKKNDSTLIYEGGWQNNRPSAMHPVYRMVENILEELDAPGEWFYEFKEQKLYFKPDNQADLKTAKVEIVRLKNLIEFNGTKEKPVQAVNLQGFIFRHAARTFMENKEPLLRSDWTVYRGGAIYYNGAEDCTLADCELDQVGGNSVFINNYNKRITVKGCYIHNSGASGVLFVGDPASVRSPIFRYGNQDYATMDRTPGPKSDNYPEDCLVEDCLITKTGRDEKQTAGVHISMSHKIRVNHCSIYDVPRAGININEGTFGGHIVENCDIFNTVLETGDHGSFNSWGRDRFWTPDVKETSAQVSKDSTLPMLDMLDPNIIRNNRWRCDHGWDIDLDDASSNYQIYNNLLLNRGLKLREGYNRIVTNNIILNNGLHPHVWFANSGDIFKYNIVFNAYKPARMNSTIASDGKWGKELDYNFYVSSKEEMNRFSKNDCEKNSIQGYPQFVDAAKGDYRVKIGSPALKLGFKNFPMDQFGVSKPSLKKIAKTPELPEIIIRTENEKSDIILPVATWMEVPLRDPVGDEFSAFGVSYSDGGVVLTQVPENSAAAKSGFKTGDLIQEINGVKIKNSSELLTYLKEKSTVSKLSILLVRNQEKMSLTVYPQKETQQPIDYNFAAMIQPVPLENRFMDEEYTIWCGSVIKDKNGKFYMFYSRWPIKDGHQSWIYNSEIALAKADKPEGPYHHVKTLFTVRGEKYWDGLVTHNPYITRYQGKYYLYYMGSTGNGVRSATNWWVQRNHQRIGVAVASDIEGNWKRYDQPVLANNTKDSTAYDAILVSNPAITYNDNGDVLMVYKQVCNNGTLRAGRVRFGVATAKSPLGPFTKKVNPIFEAKDGENSHMVAEDPFIWFQKGYYYAIVRDVVGKFTGDSGALALMVSGNGMDWEPAKHPLVIGSSFLWADGKPSGIAIERPWVYFENGEPKYLYGAMGVDKKRSKTFNVAIPLKK